MLVWMRVGERTLSGLLKEIQIFFGTDAEGSQVALDFKHGEVFLGADDDRPNQIGPIPHPMVACLTDQMTANFDEELLELLVVDRTEGGHRLCGDRNLDGLTLLTNDPGRSPILLHFFPPVLSQDSFPRALLADFFDKQLQSLGKRPLGIFE